MQKERKKERNQPSKNCSLFTRSFLPQGIAPSINIDEMDPELADLPIVTETKQAELNTVLSNSFGFGGTNGTIILGRPD